MASVGVNLSYCVHQAMNRHSEQQQCEWPENAYEDIIFSSEFAELERKIKSVEHCPAQKQLA